MLLLILRKQVRISFAWQPHCYHCTQQLQHKCSLKKRLPVEHVHEPLQHALTLLPLQLICQKGGALVQVL
jgi:hypothetical protein